jgi:hypothetical protein
MFLKRASQPFFWGLFAAATLTLPATAQPAQNTVDNSGPLSQPSIPQAFDKATGQDLYWKELGIVDDAKWVFGLVYGEKRIQDRAQRFETLYTDVAKQQNEDHAIIRTQDLSNPFGSSLLEMYAQPSGSNISKVDTVSQSVDPVSQPIPVDSSPVEPPRTVPGLW